MSARVLPAKGHENITPILWRTTVGSPSGGQTAPGQLTPHQLTPHHLTPHRADARNAEAALKDTEQRIQASHQEGYAAGLAAGMHQATERIKPVIASFASMIQELSQTKKHFRQEAEASTVGLALAVARRVLYREIAADPEAILGLVKAAFDKCNARETQKLMVSPADLAVIQEHAPRLGFPPGLDIRSDAKLARGSVVFETSHGDLDASIDTQLLEIERGFTDIIRRRRD